jgi:hypothetical protein
LELFYRGVALYPGLWSSLALVQLGSVTIAGKPATVLFAGLVASGWVDGQSTQDGVTLNFQ